MTNNYEYAFPAIRGIQAGREYYVSMCPLRLIPKIFLFDEEELNPELRAQRTLNRSRVPEISRYITSNIKDYVFSAITASIDGDVKFSPLNNELESNKNGTLRIAMDAKFIINDGQHRRAAIESAIKEEPKLGDESIAVVFFLDRGLERSQQMFSDLNRHAIRPSRSLGLLYDHRGDLARIAKLVAIQSTAFKGLVEMERSTLSERSRKLFTLSSIYTACHALLERSQLENLNSASQICVDFWDEVSKYIPEWNMVAKGKLTSGDVRKDFLHSHAIALQAIAICGAQLLNENSSGWRSSISGISNIDWSRVNSKLWEGRALVGGRVSKTTANVTLTTNYIKHKLGLKLSPEENRLEEAYLRG